MGSIVAVLQVATGKKNCRAAKLPVLCLASMIYTRRHATLSLHRGESAVRSALTGPPLRLCTEMHEHGEACMRTCRGRDGR